MSAEITREPVVAAVGDEISCPGCAEPVALDAYDGWKNSSGYTCKPATTTHSMHIETLEVKR